MNRDLKIQNAERAGEIEKEKDGSWKLRYDDGRSMYDPKEHIIVIRLPKFIRKETGKRFFVCDGHHHVVATQKVGGTTIPVREIEDYSDFKGSVDQFWSVMALKGYAYLETSDSEIRNPPSDFGVLENNDNRFFMSIAALKVRDDMSRAKYYGDYPFPVWIKLGDGIPFMELRVGQFLAQEGLSYSKKIHRDEGRRKRFFEDVRQTLRSYRDQLFILIPKKTDAKEIRFKERINRHARDRGTERAS